MSPPTCGAAHLPHGGARSGTALSLGARPVTPLVTGGLPAAARFGRKSESGQEIRNGQEFGTRGNNVPRTACAVLVLQYLVREYPSSRDLGVFHPRENRGFPGTLWHSDCSILRRR